MDMKINGTRVTFGERKVTMSPIYVACAAIIDGSIHPKLHGYHFVLRLMFLVACVGEGLRISDQRLHVILRLKQFASGLPIGPLQNPKIFQDSPSH
jgi:hypothetical protein